MKHPLCTAVALAVAVSAPVYAEVDFYGKANVTLEYASEGDSDVTELNSNASRIGIKGSEAISEDLSVVYQLEYQTEFDDSATFGQRNIFVGLKGDFGTVVAGHFDTPLKTSQKSVDLFNDLPGDIRNIIVASELRKSNSVMYISPQVWDGLQFYADYINSEDEDLDDGKSLAATYSKGKLYLALAADVDMMTSGAAPVVYDAVRLVAQYQLEQFQIGFLVEQFEAEQADSELGYMASVRYSLNDKVDLKGQFGVSDIRVEGGDTFSLGADYKLAKRVKTFAFYTNQSADNDAVDNDY